MFEFVKNPQKHAKSTSALGIAPFEIKSNVSNIRPIIWADKATEKTVSESDSANSSNSSSPHGNGHDNYNADLNGNGPTAEKNETILTKTDEQEIDIDIDNEGRDKVRDKTRDRDHLEFRNEYRDSGHKDRERHTLATASSSPPSSQTVAPTIVTPSSGVLSSLMSPLPTQSVLALPPPQSPPTVAAEVLVPPQPRVSSISSSHPVPSAALDKPKCQTNRLRGHSWKLISPLASAGKFIL